MLARDGAADTGQPDLGTNEALETVIFMTLRHRQICVAGDDFGSLLHHRDRRVSEAACPLSVLAHESIHGRRAEDSYRQPVYCLFGSHMPPFLRFDGRG